MNHTFFNHLAPQTLKCFLNIEAEAEQFPNRDNICIERKERHLSSLDQLFPGFSIAICTHNRSGLLKRCLESVLNQIDDGVSVDILVIANACTDDTVALCNELLSPNSTIYSVVSEPTPGLSVARNRALVESQREWVFFLDDDAIAHPDLIQAIQKNVILNDFDCFGGIYYPLYRHPAPNWYQESYGSNGLKSKTRARLPHSFLSGGIMGVRRNLAIAVDGFSSELGMKAGSQGYGEEVDFQVRLRHAGYVIGFDPAIQMDHEVAEAKYKLSWFMKSGFSQGLSIRSTLHENTELWLFSQISMLLIALRTTTSYLIGKSDLRWQNIIIAFLRPLSRIAGYSRQLFSAPKLHGLALLNTIPLLATHIWSRSRVLKPIRLWWHQQVLSLLTITSRLFRKKTPFTIVSTFRNADQFILECISSVYSQKYPKNLIQHVVINDNSNDESDRVISEWLQSHPDHSVKYIQNTMRLGGTVNTREAFINSDPNSIIIELNGDDKISINAALSILNMYYRNTNNWCTYNKSTRSDTREFDPKGAYPRNIILRNQFRCWAWNAGHLRSFRAKLLNHLPLDIWINPRTQKEWTSADDQAFFLGILELSGKHSKSLPIALCHYNHHDNCDDQLAPYESMRNAQLIRAQPALFPLVSLERSN